MKIRHYGIVVDDIENALECYQCAAVMHSTEVWDGKVLNIAKLYDKTEGGIELIQGDWFDHVCFECDEEDLQEMLSKNYIVCSKSKPDHYVYFIKNKIGRFIELYLKKGGI